MCIVADGVVLQLLTSGAAAEFCGDGMVVLTDLRGRYRRVIDIDDGNHHQREAELTVRFFQTVRHAP